MILSKKLDPNQIPETWNPTNSNKMARGFQLHVFQLPATALFMDR